MTHKRMNQLQARDIGAKGDIKDLFRYFQRMMISIKIDSVTKGVVYTKERRPCDEDKRKKIAF